MWLLQVFDPSQGERPQRLHTLRGQADGIAQLAWSPDDSMLLSCSREDSPEAIVFYTEVRVVAQAKKRVRATHSFHLHSRQVR